MNAVTKKIEASPLAKLREPFAPNQISKLPKESRKQIDERKNRVSGCMVWQCPECGNAHHKDAVHLDYVGHAAATDRLLDADPRWTWDPVPDPVSLGLPTAPGGMWIKLTVDGVSRYGFGCADGKTGGDAIKEIIGDAIRNAGMRFGMALDLWHKGDLHADEAAETADGGMPDAEWAQLVQLIEASKADTNAMLKHFGVKDLRLLDQDQYGKAIASLKSKLAKMAKEETNAKAREEAALPPLEKVVPSGSVVRLPRSTKQPAGEFADLDADSIPY